jgi:hypothetical protein
MTEDKLSFLDEKPADQTEVKEAVQTAASETKVEAPPIVEAKTEPVLAPTELVAPPKGDGHSVPLPKYLETFHEARELRKRLAEFENQQRQTAERPDPLLDPEAFVAAQSAAIDEKIWDNKAQMSELMARQVYGPDVVEAAFEALREKNDPFTNQRIKDSQHPWDEMVKWHKREKLLSEVGEDPAAYKARIIAEFQAQQQQAPAGGETPATAPPQQHAPVIPAASLTRSPSGPKASDVPVGGGSAFDSVFAR